MAEVTESIRQDKAKKGASQKQLEDWSGRRMILPKGTTLPADGIAGEVFVLIKDSSHDQMYIWDDSLDKFITVGPRT